MARLPLIGQSVRRKRIGIALTIWLQICRIASWFLLTLGAIHSLHTYRPRVRSYILDFYAKRDYVKRLINASDETCIEQVRMNRIAFFKLCEMLQTLGGLKSSRNMLVDEQVAEPIRANSTDPRWKWFKNCLGTLDGIHIKIRVPTVNKPRYQTRKGGIATNILGVCTPDMQFVYVLLGWEGSVVDGRVLRDAISRRHGLKVPHGKGYQPSTPEEFFNMKHASARNVIERCFGLLKLRWGILRSPSFYPIIMLGVSKSNVSFQTSGGTKRKWVPEEDAALVSYMVDLHNVGTFNADTGFKAGYLNELEKVLEKALPNAMLKARPNIESRIRVLKRDWSIVYDMLNGLNNSGFGWDEYRQLVVAEDAVWNSYLNSHKEAGQFRHRSFPYYNQLTTIYAKDRVTGKDAQTTADVIEEINVQDVPTTDINEERNEFYDCEADVSLDDMDVSATEPQLDSHQGGSTSSKKKKKNSDASDHISSSFHYAATLLTENMRAIGKQISRSIASNVVVQQKSEEFQIIQEKAINLCPTLCEIEGLTVDERYRALSKIPNHPMQMLIFFSLPSDVRLEWVRRFLVYH
ncbi:hypothetical protein GOBAR_DD03700 [Gossypium barbadense]|nr:hypothetical protein GOBAR_DD03700 [Gossypium barbadense]